MRIIYTCGGWLVSPVCAFGRCGSLDVCWLYSEKHSVRQFRLYVGIPSTVSFSAQ